MNKSFIKSISLAAFLAAAVNAQSTITVTNGLVDSGTVTSYFTVCPTATSTTITIDTTITYCPGTHCNGGGSIGPIMTPPPTNAGAPAIHVGEYTTVGVDGKTTVYGVYETVYDRICSSGLEAATYTVTMPCPCTSTPEATYIPEGFTTTTVACHVCASIGGPVMVTVTTPVSNGPYATQTSAVGASNGSGSGSSNNSGSGTNPVSGTGSGAGSSISLGSSPASSLAAATGSVTGAGAGLSSSSNLSSTYASVLGTGVASANSTMMPTAAFNTTISPTDISPPITNYRGLAGRTELKASTLIAGALMAMACLV